MAVSGIQPFISVHDSNGDPIVGAKLHVYEAGTTSYRAIYSNAGLSVSLSNPLTGANASDASGNFPMFYMASGTYKLRAETSDGTLIWQKDNIDTGLSAGSGALPIASGGTSATTAAAARAALDVPSTSELTDLSDQIADFSTSLNAILNSPGGRLTLTSNTPVLASDVTAATAVYYTPFLSDIVPIYDGSQFILTAFTEKTLTLASQHTANDIFDVFIFNDAGTIRIATGPAWSVATAGSGSRGTGAGTTELTRLHGQWVNANALATARNGATTYAIPANRGTYLGSLFIDGSNGQISCHITAGQSRKWGISNAFNKRMIQLLVTDSTASWTTVPTTWRQSRADTGNKASAFNGLPDELLRVEFTQRLASTTNSGLGAASVQCGIGINSTSSNTGTIGNNGVANLNASNVTVDSMATARAHLAPAIGVNTINCLEQAPAGTTSNTAFGTSSYMIMAVRWWG